MKVIVVGAGLTCARVLRERGAEVAVFEASGSVRTDEKDGFLLERDDSSINGSMLSGERAAREVLG
jgi:phytoene dehydrogenase-like protein